MNSDFRGMFASSHSPVQWALLKPDAFKRRLEDCPVALLPMGLCEPHGHVAALGLDLIKAEYFCAVAAEKAGGIVAPSIGYHIHECGFHAPWLEKMVGDSNPMMTGMPPQAVGYFFLYALRALANAGFRAIVGVSGHSGGSQKDLRELAGKFEARFSIPVVIRSDPEWTEGKYAGDHAGKYELSQLMAIREEWVDLSLLNRRMEPESGGRLALGTDADEARVAYGKTINKTVIQGIAREILRWKSRFSGEPNYSCNIPYKPIEALWQKATEQMRSWNSFQTEQKTVAADSRWKPYEQPLLKKLDGFRSMTSPSPLEFQHFGRLRSGMDIHQIILRNPSGMIVKIMNLGATVTSIQVPDRDGNFADVVLGFHTLPEYEAGHPFFGSILGRNAGRLKGGDIEIEGKTYHLSINEGENHLHGGWEGFDKRVWKWNHVAEGEATLSYLSEHGEEGYPGNLEVKVTYTLTRENELKIEYVAETDQATVFNPTHHSWFNLGGEGHGDVLDHELSIYSETVTPLDETMALSGKAQSVMETANDFRSPRLLRKVIPELFRHHGENYLFPRRGTLQRAARLLHPPSGRTLEVFTTERCLQFYSGKDLDGKLRGKAGQFYGPFAGLCLECQGFPEGVKFPEIQETILRPGETYKQLTIYRFSSI